MQNHCLQKDLIFSKIIIDGNPRLTSMNLDILFVMPSMKMDLKDESVGTLILAKKAIMSGYNARIVRFWELSRNLNDYNVFRSEAATSILRHKASIVSFYCRCSDYHICIDLSNLIKGLCPQVKIIFGGPQAELVAKETLTYFSNVDFVSCSEGENTIVPFLDYVFKGFPVSAVKGLVYRDQYGMIHQNKFPKFLPNNYVRGFYYYDLIPNSVISNNKGTNIDVGRGCPFTCTFCSTKTFWKQKYRLRNTQDIINEIDYLVKKFGINYFSFDHDLFTVNNKKIKEFCHQIIQRDLKIKWYCSSRIDTITEELIDIMAAAGCYKILYGIETGSPRMQKIVRKNLNLEKCEPIVKYTKSKGLKVVASFIYGFPEETEEDFEYTFELMQNMQILGARAIAWRCGILNGTEMFEKYNHILTLEPNNACNSSFWGYDELYHLIEKHKDVFPHFCNFHSELRTELIYLEIFRSIWNYYEPKVYWEIFRHFEVNKYPMLSMYRKFVKTNQCILESIQQKPEESFWGATDEECYRMTNQFKKLITL